MRWYRHVLSRDYDNVLRRALDFEAVGIRGRRQPNTTKDKWKNILN